MTRVFLHHRRAGRRLALRRGLEVAGVTVEVVDEAAALASGTPDDVLVVDGDATVFLDAIESRSPEVGTTIRLGVDVPADVAVESLVDMIQGRPSAPGQAGTLDPIDGELVHGGGLDDLEARIDRLAVVDLPVLVVGESGVGKEVVARALHARGPRRDHPFVVVAAGGSSGELLESELFGHVRGAFTDAVADRTGRLEQAGPGTLLLDEIADVPLGLQATFLRVLQDRHFRRVGGTDERPFRARIVATTQRDLRGEVHAGRFREDLYHRLAGATLEVPPLRERPGDVAPLARHLLHRRQPEASITPAALARLENAPWAGNVRELDHVLQRSCLLADDLTVDEVHIKTTLDETTAVDPDGSLTRLLRNWAISRHRAGEGWTSVEQRLMALWSVIRDDLDR